MRVSYHTKAVGVTFEGRQDTIKSMPSNSKLRLRREPQNQYDPQAVAIDALIGRQWLPIGYIAKDKNGALSTELDKGTKVEVVLTEVTGGGDKSYGVNIAINYETLESLSQEEMQHFDLLTPVIGKGKVRFDPVGHAYYDAETGERLQSGSVFESLHTPEFDMSYPAKAMAKSIQGVAAIEIQQLWEEHGTMAASFGTAAHNALEMYFKNRDLMVKVDEYKQRPHTPSNFMPKTLGDIVEAFLAQNTIMRPASEVFVRYEGRCGFIDLLDEDDNGNFIIHDYKFITKLKKVNYSGYGEYDKYTLQQNFYREILEKNGLPVVGMYLHPYMDNEWQEPVKVEKITL